MPFIPPEILSIVAEKVVARKGEEEKLGPYALVCKAWQAAFEPHIYEYLEVGSPSETTTVSLGPEGKYGIFDKRGITLESLAAATSGPHEWSHARRAAIRRILYKVAVPHYLDGDKDLDEDGSPRNPNFPVDERFTAYLANAQPFSYDNVYRRQNDEAFTNGMQSLFELFSTWTDQKYPSDLSIVLEAENVYSPDQNVEPGIVGSDGLGKLIAEYGADFSAGHSLPTVECVSSLDFPESWSPVPINYTESSYMPDPQPSTSPLAQQNRISPASAFRIASACRGDALKTIKVDGIPFTPERERELNQQRRSAIAENLSGLPRSVREVEFQWQSLPSGYELPELSSHPVYQPSPDALCRALHLASTHLRKLVITDLDVSPELFEPISEGDCWPHLETLEVTDIPEITSSGFNLYYTFEPDSSEYVCPSFLEQLYSSVARAALRMPRITLLLVSFSVKMEEVSLKVRDDDGRRVLSFSSRHKYAPSQAVWDAWKAKPENIKFCGENDGFGYDCSEAEWDVWPPR